MGHVKLEDYPRPDGTWPEFRIDEATSADGPWTPVETMPVVGSEDFYTFETSLATLPAGWYLGVWLDGLGGETPTAPLFNGGPVAPSVQQVARFLRARTTGDGGELGVFTASTNPNIEQVEEYIATATMDVIAEAGRELPAGAQDLAKGVITIGAAVLIEINSEQINTERLRALTAMYDKRLASFVNAAQDVEQGGDPGQVDDRPMPLGTFPCATPLEW